ncbi:MAG: hypothetical protein RDU76_11580 [Candidatus Edwardsbacteria bacterium]|nr:hypothetical protein [Candidatus Edwardsbacteria bacterium]
MNWLEARAYEQIKLIFQGEDLTSLGLQNILIGENSWPAAGGLTGEDLLPQLPAVVLIPSENNGLTYNNIANHYQQINLRVKLLWVYADGEDPIVKCSDALSLLVAALINDPTPIAVGTGESLYTFEPSNVTGFDKEAGRFWEDVGLNIAEGRFDLLVRAQSYQQ